MSRTSRAWVRALINGEVALTRQDAAFALHTVWPGMPFALEEIAPSAFGEGVFLAPVPIMRALDALAGRYYAKTATSADEEGNETLSSVEILPSERPDVGAGPGRGTPGD